MNTEKAIEIVNDAIAQLKAKRYSAINGTYVSFPGVMDIWLLDKAQMQKIAQENTCKVCALGSLFTSCISLYNNTTGDTVSRTRGSDQMEQREIFDIFEREDLEFAEYAFERGSTGIIVNNRYEDAFGYDDKTLKIAEWYGRRYSNANDRLMAILRNFQRNKGRFVLPKRIRN